MKQDEDATRCEINDFIYSTSTSYGLMGGDTFLLQGWVVLKNTGFGVEGWGCLRVWK
jgi:hypothetical protein